jgi:hypothetical protein
MLGQQGKKGGNFSDQFSGSLQFWSGGEALTERGLEPEKKGKGWRFGFWVETEKIFHQGAIESLENLGIN